MFKPSRSSCRRKPRGAPASQVIDLDTLSKRLGISADDAAAFLEAGMPRLDFCDGRGPRFYFPAVDAWLRRRSQPIREPGNGTRPRRAAGA